MPAPTFTAGQRVYHRRRKQYGTYVELGWNPDESVVDFGGAEHCRVTTAQLVPADEVQENA